MRKLLSQIIQWALRANDSGPILNKCETVRSDSIPSFRIGVMKAMNGRILEVSTYKPNSHGPDWTNEMFIVPEDQTLTQALTTLLILKGLNT
jgi:hypothetical protein